MIRCKNYFLVC